MEVEKLRPLQSLAEVQTSRARRLENYIDYGGEDISPLSSEHIHTYRYDDIDSTVCLFPFEVKVPISSRFPTGKRQIPCGHCEDCKRRKRNEWFFRLKQEAKDYPLNLFVTLTYDDENVPLDTFGNMAVDKRDIQLFFKRLRKKLSPHKIRYYGISEYGPTTFRPHYHVIIFNWPVNFDAWSVLLNIWGKADNIVITPILDQQMMYVARYHTDKGFTPQYFEKTFTFMSRNPGIGASFASKDDVLEYYHADPERSTAGTLEDGKKTSLGRYLRKKIYGDDFETPRHYMPSDNISKEERLINYYAKKAKRRAKLNGKI